MFFLESNNVGFLLVEVNGLVDLPFKGTRDLLHGVDHGGDLDV